MENNPDAHIRYDPRDALADVASSRASVADRLVTPWWYHPALGTALAGLVLVGALDLPSAARLAVALACAVAMGGLVTAYQRLTGLWVDARNLGPASGRWWVAYIVVVAVMVALSLVPSFTDVSIPVWSAVLMAVIVLAATVVLGRRIDAALRDEIRTGAVAAPRAPRAR